MRLRGNPSGWVSRAALISPGGWIHILHSFIHSIICNLFFFFCCCVLWGSLMSPCDEQHCFRPLFHLMCDHHAGYLGTMTNTAVPDS